MSIDEKNISALKKLAALQNEASADEILTHLNNLNNAPKPRIYNLLKHAEAITEQYGETLQKLAQ